ncbi:MAG: hypothetical protein CFH41_01680 [Alphaproteobacteria bacterium MarineAlpha11_Bin1]|nr:MAG: hypothetical protein CFH41_01680 [Alphaproteobacteria bacterium MarineAlpha11_Bin1]|tara:strand:+ start:511 stop:756 length:246 start_codon:yes stop_codon:yes gene_type:complete
MLLDSSRFLGKVTKIILAEETYDGTWVFNANFFYGNGFRQHYLDKGTANGRNGTSQEPYPTVIGSNGLGLISGSSTVMEWS